MPGKIKFRIKITEIIIITKTLSTIDDDIRSNVTLHKDTYRTCHDHLQFTPMNEIPTLFCHPIRNTSHCLWLERKYLSNPIYLITGIFASSSPRPHYALNGPLSSRTHLPWTFSQESPTICFPFFLEIQLLVTVRITGNNFKFLSDLFTTQLTNIEFKTLRGML